ncbi:MAG: hypothetical protein JWM95_451 [Gemmatimonadetes bacterium]|nr:hypothetical protein [Gemmatimonadota bacterium]
MTHRRSGFALMAALWLVVLVGITGYELSVRSRARRLAIANSLEAVQAKGAAEAASQTAQAVLALLLKQNQADPWRQLTGFRADTSSFGDERAMARVVDVGSLLQINRASEDDIRRLLAALPLDAGDADRLAQCIMDWKDADNARRGRGAERDDYLVMGARVLPPNATVASIEDLRNVNGVTSALYARFSLYVTVHGSGKINVNSAPRVVLRSLAGLTDEAIDVLLATRQSTRPIRSMEELMQRVSSGSRAALLNAGSELAGKIIFDTRQVLIESDGWVVGSPVRSHMSVVVERSGDAMNIVASHVVR